MGKFRWQIVLGIGLILVSAASYGAQIILFHREQDTFFYLLQDLAFLPIQVSLVTLVINEAMRLREKSAVQHKMNMVIGAFFSDAGNDMLRFFYRLDSHRQAMCAVACVRPSWDDKDFVRAKGLVERHEFAIQFTPADLRALKEMMIAQRPYVMNLLSNPSLLEHESFTDLMWATSHLAEELAYRDDMDSLPDSDCAHLAGDITRAYSLLVAEWVQYARHLREAYPYIYSLVVRTNPFDPEASVVVGEGMASPGVG